MSEAKKRNIIGHLLTIGMGSIINMIIGFFTTPILTRIVDPTELGQMSIITTYSSIASMVLCCGLDQAMFRFYYEEDSIEYKQSLIRFCFGFASCASLSSFFIVLACIVLKVKFEFSYGIMFLLCIHIEASIWDRISTYILRLDYKSKAYAACNIIRRVSYLLFVIIPSLIFRSHYLLILIIASVLSMLVTFLVAVLKAKHLWKFKNMSPFQKRKEVLVYGLPLILSMALATLFQAIDRLCINQFCTYADVGVYSSAQTIVSVFAIVQTTFNAVWVPMQIEHYTKKPNETAFFQKGNQYITVVMFFLGVCLIASKDIIVFLLGEKYRDANLVIPFLAFEPIMYTISETMHVGIGYAKKSHLGIYISGISCLVNFIGNQLLIPRVGIRGAAISTGLSYTVFLILRALFSNKYLYVNYKPLKLCIMTVVTTAYAYCCTFYSSALISVIGFIICIVTMATLYFQTIIELFNEVTKQITEFIKRKKEPA